MVLKRGILVGAGLAILLVGTCAVSGTSLLPPGVALGPCLKDWTSPTSYQRRASPLATVRGTVGPARVEVCYGRPSARGRTVFGKLVPYDSLWRAGANEPTRLYTDQTITLAGITLQPGRYSLYAIPRPDSWTVFVSRSVLHWGNDISPGVRAQEVGSARVPVEPLETPVETLTVTLQRDTLAFAWERTRVTLPIAPVGG
ncbi:MAG TPA: DUF2911 domain-containing protein [Gemmatimonadales bacterium]|nr:DUF2911 domain-containing protein [Gemmatimonadales bacterium]